MSLINLLPENFTSKKKNKKKQKRVIAACSAFLVLASVISCAAVYADKVIASKKSDFFDAEMKKIEIGIEREINNNELFLTGDEIRNIRSLLNNHNYFSKAFNVIQNTIAEDVYLTESELSFGGGGDLMLKISGMADNHLAIVNQIAIFKNSFWIDSVEIDGIAADSGAIDDGDKISFDGNLKFKKDLVLFREYYWDFGLALLSSKVDRYIKIDKYSAVLMGGESGGKDYVKVEFDGIAYDEEKLILFEDDLKQLAVFVKNISISRDFDKKNGGKAIKFKGEMELTPF